MPSISPYLVPNMGSPPTSPLPPAGRPRSRSSTLSRATSFSSTSSRRSQPEVPPLPPNLPPAERSRSRSSTLSHATSFSSTSSRHSQVPPSTPPPDGRPRSRSSTLSRATSFSSTSSRHHVPLSPYNRDKALPVPPLPTQFSPSKDASTSYHSDQRSYTAPARPTPDLPRLSTSPETRVLPQGHTGVVPRSHGPSNTVKNVRRKRTIGDGADVGLLGPEVVQVPDTTHASVKTLLHEVQLYISLLYCAIEERSPRSQMLQTAKTAVQWNTRLFQAMDPVARNSNDPRAFYELQHAAEMALSHLISYILAASSLTDDLWTIAPDLLDMVVRAVVLSVRLISPDNPAGAPSPSSAHAPAPETPHRRASRDHLSRKSASSRLSSSSETSLSSIDSESPTAPTPTAEEKDAQWVYYGFSNIPRKPLAPNHPLSPPKVCLDYSIMKVIGRGYDPDSRAPYVVRSGTLRALVYVLTENPDSQLRDELQEIFFTCFRLWGVHAVFDALMAQYPPRARAHGLDSEIWNKHAIAHQATQQRVMSLLTTWVHCHWRFEDWVALDALYEFATTQTLRISPATSAAEDLAESLDALRQTTPDQRTGPRTNDSDRRMKPKWLDPNYYSTSQARYMDALVRDLANDHLASGNPGRYTLNISRFGGKKWWIALASQITLVSHDLIRAFRAEDIISHDQHGGRKCKGCPTSRQLAELRTFHEGLVFWVQRNVFGLGSTEERMDGLRNFIELAEELRSLKSLDAFVGILSGLDSSAIRKLDASWQLLGMEYPRTLEIFKKLLKDQRRLTQGYPNAESFMRPLERPVVPCFAPFLNAFDHNMHGGKTTVKSESGNDLINLEPYRALTRASRLLDSYRIGYDFPHMPHLQGAIRDTMMVGIETIAMQEAERMRLLDIASDLRKHGGELVPGFELDDGLQKENLVEVPPTPGRKMHIRRPSLLDTAAEFLARKLSNDEGPRSKAHGRTPSKG